MRSSDTQYFLVTTGRQRRKHTVTHTPAEALNEQPLTEAWLNVFSHLERYIRYLIIFTFANTICTIHMFYFALCLRLVSVCITSGEVD